MGQQPSKDELLYQKAIDGDIDAVRALCSDGTGFERNGSHEPLQSRFYAEQDTKSKHGNKISIEEDKHEEQLSLRIRRKVTFDANVKKYEPVLVCESTELLEENIQDNNEKEKDENSGKPSIPCYPSNHRYNNCQENGEEVDELESQESYFMYDEHSRYVEEDDFESYDESGDETVVGQQISSLSMRERKTDVPGLGARDRGVYTNPVLNPVNNIDQWKALKMKTKIKTENLKVQLLYDSKFKTDQLKNQDREVAVDASLSNWLVSSNTTLEKKATFDSFKPMSPEMSAEDRLNLGTLTAEEEVIESEGSISPKRSLGLRPYEMPMTGSVGNNWSNSGQRVKDIGAAFSYKRLPNSTSKCQELLVK